jgi:hypothetical protein
MIHCSYSDAAVSVFELTSFFPAIDIKQRGQESGSMPRSFDESREIT